jgi:type II secretory pathway pseudopilin PulG
MKKKNKKGYTLVEMIIYISLIVMIMISVVGIVIAVMKSNKYVGALNEIENSAILSLNRISREIRIASSATLLNSSNISFGTTTIYLNSSLGQIYINDGSGPNPLTSSKVNVSRLFFTKITSTSSTAIKIEMTLNTSSSDISLSKDFNTTTVLRGTK